MHKVTNSNIQTYWSSRASLGTLAGTRDIIAKQIEIETISEYIADGLRILDIGCGNGITAIELARRYKIDIIGIDFAEDMITAAKALAGDKALKGTVRFEVGDVQHLHLEGKFDLIYTERTLVNLPNWEAQKQAIKDITDLLVEGGRYLMCENSQDGLDMINALRERIHLPIIESPWHNRYLLDREIERCKFAGVTLEGISHYSSTYYFLSRIVNAWLAAREGNEPEYDSPVNQLALQLPSIGDLGQGRIWVWRKAKEWNKYKIEMFSVKLKNGGKEEGKWEKVWPWKENADEN